MKTYILLIVALFSLNIMANAQTLDDYFKIAAKNNPGLQAKFKKFEATMQRVIQVSSLPDPSLTIGYFVSPVETNMGTQLVSLSLTQMFPWFGTLKAQENAATFVAEATYQEFLDARNKLYYQVAAAYYPLVELHRITSIEEENQHILSSYKDFASIKFQNGKGAMVDVLRVDIMLKDAITNLSILKQKKKSYEARFKTLLNWSGNEQIMIQDSLFIINLPSEYRKDSLLLANPLLNELDLKIKASKANEEVAIKQGLPKLGLGLEYIIVSENTAMAGPDNGKDMMMPMLTVSLPLFRGKYKAAQKEARLTQESYSLQRQEVVNKLTGSYYMVRFEVQKQVELIKLYEEQIQESEQSLNLLFSAYSNSGKDFEEVLRMQQQILKYKKMKVTALSEFHIALAELDYITSKSK